MNKKLEEQRDSGRKPATNNAYVRYRLSVDGVEELHASPLKDLSFTGIKLVCLEPIPIGSCLDMTVFLSRRGPSFEINGQIRWCLEIDEVPTYYAGVSVNFPNCNERLNWRSLFN